jgi:hypothetical protein
MGLIEELLGCPLQQLTRSFWVVRLNTGEWVSEARVKTDVYQGRERHFDWVLDLVANGDVLKIQQLWLLCPPSKTSPLGNTARLDITEPGTAFQFKVATVDSSIVGPSIHGIQAHIIGRVDNKETGDCTCYIYDPIESGMITPETQIYNPATGGVMRDEQGNPICAGKTNVYNFHSWRPSLPPRGRLALDVLGVRL